MEGRIGRNWGGCWIFYYLLIFFKSLGGFGRVCKGLMEWGFNIRIFTLSINLHFLFFFIFFLLLLLKEDGEKTGMSLSRTYFKKRLDSLSFFLFFLY